MRRTPAAAPRPRRTLPRRQVGYQLDGQGYPIEPVDDRRDAARWRALIRGVNGAGDVRVDTESHQPHAPHAKDSSFLTISVWSEREMPMHRYLSVCRLFAYVDAIIKRGK